MPDREPRQPALHAQRPPRDARITPVWSWGKLILWVVSVPLMLVVGAYVGIAFDLAAKIEENAPRIIAALGYVIGAAIGLLILLLITRYWLLPSVSASGTALLKRLTDELGRATVGDVHASLKRAGLRGVTRDLVRPLERGGRIDPEFARFLRRFALRVNLALRNAGIAATDAAPRVLKGVGEFVSAWLVGRAYWRMLGAIGGLIVAGVGTAQLVVLIQQTARLTEANNLIQLEAQLAVLARQADLQEQEAARRYDEIAKILDESKSPAAQEYALLILPEAMLMPVDLVDPTWKPSDRLDQSKLEPRMIIAYPNLRRLAERLLVFVRQDRVKEVLNGAEHPSAQVSTAICRALHRLGYGAPLSLGDPGEPQFGTCVWDLVFDEEGRPRNAALLPRDIVLQPSPSQEGHGGHLDLRHMRRAQLRSAKLPGVKLRAANLQGIDLRFAVLEDADLAEAWLHDADLSESTLDNADLRWVRAARVNMFGAALRSTDLSHASMPLAIFSEAQLQGAMFHFADLSGAVLTGAELQRASFVDADLAGAVLDRAQLHETTLWGTVLWGARFRNATLIAADLSLSDLSGTEFDSAELGGACLDKAQLVAARFCNANFAASVVRLVPVVECNLAFWRNPTQLEVTLDPSGRNWRAEHVAVSAATITGGGLGRAFVLDPELYSFAVGSYRVFPSPTLANKQVQEAYGDSRLLRAVWPRRADAESEAKTALGDQAGDWVFERATEFVNARLHGVLIDQETIDRIPPDGCTPPAAEVFGYANKDPRDIKARLERPYELPDPREALRQRAASQPARTPAPQPTTAPSGPN